MIMKWRNAPFTTHRDVSRPPFLDSLYILLLPIPFGPCELNIHRSVREDLLSDYEEIRDPTK